MRGRKVLARQGALPAMVVAEIVERDRDGELIARPVEWSGLRRGAAHSRPAAAAAARIRPRPRRSARAR